ncbi:MAG: S4 domain-containing protein [Thiohalophilus sp.]|uniref:RNA-binding S4 domain-containing protein n=1 Tax=Thiohalophilus sp. TaxID=3028392 RepID=UPI002870629E|nr:S4 domain-containing protein [Thiohalophilus sp.]MDR9436823.1 S4 domain-containing protein [Thiohalophilus sp.]
MSSDSTTQIRLDKWLWAARFYKTRMQASEAINGGHIKLNGQRTKPGARLQIGDQLFIRKQMLTFDIIVRELAQRRGPASVAERLYEETVESVTRRETQQAARREQARLNPRPKRKPDKRERRKIIRFVNKYSQENS